ncbi:hypothetical protein GDO86_013524, partial [Hymenochirus boettgeri]
MAESSTDSLDSDNVSKMLTDMNKDLENMLEQMEKNLVRTTWLAYDMVVIRTDPALAQSMKKLEDAFVKCKEELQTNWQKLLDENKQQ